MADKSHCALPEQTAFPFELPPAMSGPEFCSLPCGFPGGSDGKESACNVGDLGSIPKSGRSLGKGMATHSHVLTWKIWPPLLKSV